ncbi:glutathione S-transferase family protein [Marinobacterium sp. CAU 1594]|nr:glutathione S-transferase family protein [Marinobacterium arenosum]
MKLVIGNKNYSSWSLRPWLLMQHFGLACEEIPIALFTPQMAAELPALSPSGKVPVLHDGDVVIWDSLAICEYLSERYLDGRGWPADLAIRGHARAVCAEMHSGFAALRSEMSMNLRRPIGRRAEHAVSDQCHADIRRIEQIWLDCLARYDGPWLFGEFSIADAMFAPVASRLHTYAVELSAEATGYVERQLSQPAFQQWRKAALQETGRIEFCEYDD